MKTTALLHLSDLHFGPHNRFAEEDPAQLALRLVRALEEAPITAPPVDVVVVSGDVAEAGKKKELATGLTFFGALAEALELPRERFVFLPGNHDISWLECRRAEVEEEAEEKDEPDEASLRRRLDRAKLRLFDDFLHRFYEQPADEVAKPLVNGGRLFDFPELRLSVAALNSCERESHRPDDHYGSLSAAQAQSLMDAWRGAAPWLRVVAVHHNPGLTVPANRESWRAHLLDKGLSEELLQRYEADVVGFEGHEQLEAIVQDAEVSLVLHGHHHARDEALWSWRGDGAAHVLSAGSPSLRAEKLPKNEPASLRLIELTPDAPAPRLRAVTLIYEARKRQRGKVVKGSFVVDPADGGIYDKRLDLPQGWTPAEEVGEAAPASEPAVPASKTNVKPLSPPLKRYVRSLRAHYRHLPVLGFGAHQVRIPLSLEEIYVPLQAEAYGTSLHPGGREGWELRGKEGSREVPFDEALTLAGEFGYTSLVVLGDPGSGKTTLLKHFLLAVTEAGGPEALGLPPETLPVLIELRNLRQPARGLRSALREMLSKVDLALETPARLAQQLLRHHHLLVLVDGLDEVASDQQRAAVVDWLQEAIEGLGHCTFVVTSRFAGYHGECRLPAALELRVRDLEEPEVRRFIESWYGAVERQIDLDRAPAAAAARAAERAEELAACIFDGEDLRTRSLRELAGNPMMLQILCLLYRDRGYLPERRAELYRECVHLLLALWRQRKLPVSFTSEQALAALQPLAWWLQTKGRKRATLKELLPSLKAPLKAAGWAPEHLEQLLQAIRDQSGVLVSLGDGSYAFLHLSLQEYLCARHVQDQCLVHPDLLTELAQHFGEEGWREVLLLSLGLDNPSLFVSLMDELLWAEVLHRDPLLAADCLRDALAPQAGPLVEALEHGVASSEERHQVLQLLKAPEMEGWRGVKAAGGKKGEEIVRGLREGDEDEGVRRLAAELMPVQVLDMLMLDATSEIHVPTVIRTRTHEKDGSVLIYVPGGDYRLGADDVHNLSKPVHTVTLSPFWIGKYPVTNAQYRRFLAAEDHGEPEYWDNKRFNQPEQPVVGVSWDDAAAYCRWAGLSLPTEAQWEAAARGTDGRRYPWGDAPPSEKLTNFGENVGRTTPVGTYPAGAGPFGTEDQAGNVWEWCQDVWDERAYADRDGQRDPVTTEGDSSLRCLRGGSWANESGYLPAAFRNWFEDWYRDGYSGFRVVFPVPAEP